MLFGPGSCCPDILGEIQTFFLKTDKQLRDTRQICVKIIVLIQAARACSRLDSRRFKTNSVPLPPSLSAVSMFYEHRDAFLNTFPSQRQKVVLFIGDKRCSRQ